MQYPHQEVAKVIDGIATEAERAVGGIGSTIDRGLSEVSNVLDTPLKMTLGIRGPHWMATHLLMGWVDAAENTVSRGWIGSARRVGRGISAALDEPCKIIGKIL